MERRTSTSTISDLVDKILNPESKIETMKTHSFTFDPLHTGQCYRCQKPIEDRVHRYKPVFLSPGQRPVRCLACGGLLHKSKTPARDFVVGSHSLQWREDRCHHCGCPYQYRRSFTGKVEFQLVDDLETGRMPEKVGK